jgi:hypothetical protein
MTPESTVFSTSSPGVDKKGLANFRLIPRIETYPRLVAFAQTKLGKVALLCLFGAGLMYFRKDIPSWFVMMPVFVLTSFLPTHRRLILTLGTMSVILRHSVDLQRGFEPGFLVLNLAAISLGMVLFWCARRWPQSLFGRRPIVCLLSGITLLIVCADWATPAGRTGRLLWAAVSVSVAYIWFIAYALTDKSAKPAGDATLEIAALHPVWGSTATPFPKGAAYLRRIEAKDAKQLAITQLKGLKLLAWALLLAMLRILWNRFFHGYLAIPLPKQAMALSVLGTPVAWKMRWASQILLYFDEIFEYSIFGHRIIACCRLAGFNALRSTYRPLSAVSLIEFFNRFYYYFKELLVDFFYYPAFFRYWKGYRRFRVVFATFAAVFFGNSFYHLIRDWQYFRDYGLLEGLKSYQVLFFSNGALALGLSISQLRKRGSKPSGFFRRQLVPSCGVAVFYILLGVFMDESRAFSLAQTFKYFLSLFFIHW